MGDQTVEPGVDSNTPGHAEAFRFTATTTGTVSSLSVFVDSTSTASSLVAGVYTSNGSHAGTLLAQASVFPAGGVWNTIPLPAASIVSGTTYWIALLAP